MALTLRRICTWSLAVPAITVAFMAACGLDTMGTRLDLPGDEGPEGGGSLPPAGDGSTSSNGDADGGDAQPPETCSWSSLQRGAPWPMLGGCVRHPGRTVFRGPKQQPKTIWKVTVTTRESQPVIGADDTIYVPANDNGVAAFAPDGGPRQSVDSGTGVANNVTNAPSIGADGTLYFGSEHDIVAYRKDGTFWRYKTSEEIDTSTLVDENGTVYSGSFNDKLYAILPDGGLWWERGLGGDVWASAAMGPTGDLYVGASNDLFALQRDGGESWRFETIGDIQSSPVVADDGTIYVGTIGTRLHAIHPDGGAKWTFIPRGNFGWQQLPALGKDGTIYTPTNKHLAAIDPSDGGVKWEIDVGFNLRTSVIVDADGDLYVGGDKKMAAFRPNGDKLWEVDVGENPFGFAIGRDGTLYVALNNNALVALHE